MDADDGFKKKRRNLILLSILLIAIVVSGADIKEANSLFFKIEFADHGNLQWLLVAGICYSVLRYYAYAEPYRDKLFIQWSSRFMGDRKVFYYSSFKGEVEGLLGKILNRYYDEEASSISAGYRITGLFKREIDHTSKAMREFSLTSYTQTVELNKYDESWTRKDLLSLLYLEFKYRINAWVAHRETLDLVAPYLLAAGSLITFFYSKYH